MPRRLAHRRGLADVITFHAPILEPCPVKPRADWLVMAPAGSGVPCPCPNSAPLTPASSSPTVARKLQLRSCSAALSYARTQRAKSQNDSHQPIRNPAVTHSLDMTLDESLL